MKLRDDITLKEAYRWCKDRDFSDNNLGTIARDINRGDLNGDYPHEWFEAPPKGSFGKFENSTRTWTIWGHLREVETSVGSFVCNETGTWYTFFTPGLPTDVDADGMPKEVAE